MNKCRACLKIEDKTVKMYQFDQITIGYFNLLTDLDAKLTDIMPQQICESCLGMVNLFIEFRNKCISANSILLEINISKNIKEEEIQRYHYIDISTEHIKQEVDKCKVDFISGHNISEYSNVDDNCTYEMIVNNKKFKEVHNNQFQRVNTKSSSPNYSCGLCIKEYKEKKLLLTHLNEHKSDNMNLCDLCKQKFSDWHQLFSHRIEHLRNKNEKECHICFSKFTSPPYLEFHYKKVHSLINNPLLKCLPCNENFTTPQKLQRHLWNCHLENKFNYSSWGCNDENGFQNPIAKHTQCNILVDEKNRPCEINNTNSKKSTFQCETCSKCYTTSIKLRKHIRRMHCEKKYICDYCSKEYSFKNELKSHIERHMNIKIYACDECEYVSKFSTNLKFHKIRKHTTERVYCTVCSRVFTDQMTLDAHNCKRKSLVCSTCGKTFKAHKQLSRHMVSHEAAGRYACPRCPARLRSRAAWRAHRDRHDGVRAHACPRCPAAFYSSSVLTKHMRKHTGIKPYVCKICQKAFTGNNNLKVHMKVHGEYLIKKKEKN